LLQIYHILDIKIWNLFKHSLFYNVINLLITLVSGVVK